MKLTSALGLAAGALAAILAASAPASAAVVTLPTNTATCGTTVGTNCLVFGDFTVFSLALLNFQAGYGDVNGNDPFAVSTNGTNLQNALVVGTGVGGQGSINTDQILGGLVDNAYDTPNSNGGLTNFATAQGVPNVDTSTQGAQGGSIPNNSADTWDVSISALNTYLNGGNLTFFFNLNQTGSNVTTYLNNPEDALGYLAVTLRNDDGSVSNTWYLNGNNCTGAAPPSSDPLCPAGEAYPQNNTNNTILPNPTDEWAYVHGQICVANDGSLIGFGACTGPGNTVNQNLGAGLAAFALFSQDLQDGLTSGLYTVMSVDLRMAGLDNGYEQLLIYSSNDIPQEVPEPLTIGLFGAGLAGVALLRRRRKAPKA